MWGAGTGPDRPFLLSWAGHTVLAGVGAEEGVVGGRGAGPRVWLQLQLTIACNALTKPSDTPTLHSTHLGEDTSETQEQKGWISPQDKPLAPPNTEAGNGANAWAEGRRQALLPGAGVPVPQRLAGYIRGLAGAYRG